ncbi:MAG: hypothetical protein ABI402_11415 [Ferruginibacter sp.]
MSKKIIILLVINLYCFNSFCQDLSVNKMHDLIFSKSPEASNKILSQNGFEFDKIFSSQDRSRKYIQYHFFKKSNENKVGKEEIILFRQKDLPLIEKLDYSTSKEEIYTAFKKDADLTLETLGEKINTNCKMTSYSGNTLLETFENCNTAGFKSYKMIVFNLQATPIK